MALRDNVISWQTTDDSAEQSREAEETKKDDVNTSMPFLASTIDEEGH